MQSQNVVTLWYKIFVYGDTGGKESALQTGEQNEHTDISKVSEVQF